MGHVICIFADTTHEVLICEVFIYVDGGDSRRLNNMDYDAALAMCVLSRTHDASTMFHGCAL